MRPHKRPRCAPSSPPESLLCDDLIFNILSRLPVKSLLRFRCVCKSWKSLISNPYFVKSHFQQSSANAKLVSASIARFSGDSIPRNIISYPIRALLCDPSSTLSEEEDLCYPLKRRCQWLLSCNGLLCLVDLLSERPFTKFRFCIWNPATRFISDNVPSLNMWQLSCECSMPRLSFGYDHLSDTYKVVAIFSNLIAKMDSRKTLVKVCNMGDSCWRTIQSFPVIPTRFHNDGEFFSGTLNWIADRDSSNRTCLLKITNDELVIVSLDLNKETHRQLSLPSIVDEVPHVQPILGVFKECLCVFHDHKKTHFVLWQMEEFGDEKSWTQLVNVSLQDIQGCLKFPFFLSPLCMSENGDMLMVSDDKSLAVLYNRKDNRLECTQIPSNIKRIFAKPKVYVESLVLPR